MNYRPACEAWWEAIKKEGEELILEGSEWAAVEYALHELCHASVIGTFPASTELVRFVTSRVDSLPMADQIAQEIDTSAIEYFVCQKIDIPFEKGDITAAVEVQNIDCDDMLEALKSEQPYKEHVAAVIEQLDLWMGEA